MRLFLFVKMPRIYVLKESIKDPVVTKTNLTEYEASVDARFDLTATTDQLNNAKTEIQGIVDQAKADMQQVINEAKTELQQNDEKIKNDIMDILEQIKVKASDTEPEEADDLTVWFDIENKLVKVRKDGQWIPMGAVYQ